MMDEDELGDINVVLSDKQITDSSRTQHIESIQLCKHYIANVLVKCPQDVVCNGKFEKWKKNILLTHLLGKIEEAKESFKQKSKHQPDHGFVKATEFSSSTKYTTSKINHILAARFLDDKTFVMAIDVCLTNMYHHSSRANLNLGMINKVPDFPINPKEIADDFLPENSQSTTRNFTCFQKRLTKSLVVSGPPMIQVKYKDATGKHLLFMKICNAGADDIRVQEFSTLPGSCHVSEELTAEEEKHALRTGSPCQEYGIPLKRIYSESSVAFPFNLSHLESVSLIYEVLTEEIDSKLKDLTFHLHLKWTYATEGTTIETSYNLPKMKIRHVPFVMNANCAADNITLGQSFTVEYNIKNNLQDFVSWKLYWDMPVAIKENQSKQEQKSYSQKGIICHNPIVDLGKLKKNEIQHIKVDFTVLETGLHEFGKQMKMNLTYTVPSEDYYSRDVQQEKRNLEDKGPEDLWRDRHGSTSSLGDKDHLQPEEKRFSYATKSYSFGDFGPTNSQDSNEGTQLRNQENNYTSVHSSLDRCTDENEAFTLTANSFKKNSLHIYIP